MKFLTPCTSAFLAFALVVLQLPFAAAVRAQDPSQALERGYRTGYSDGYMAGYRDSIDGAPKGVEKHSDYKQADRAFSPQYGAKERYQDGYRQGFESGYEAGFSRQPFNAVVPADLRFRGEASVEASGSSDVPADKNDGSVTAAPPEVREEKPVAEGARPAGSDAANAGGSKEVSAGTDDEVLVIKRDTELILELETELGTEASQVGDKFRAKVVSPIGLTGAVVEGHVDKIRRPGRIKRRGEMLLAFDRILISESRWGNLSAIMTEVLPVKGDNVKRVDSEGTVEGKLTDRSDAARVGGTSGAGAVVGGIVGGPVGVVVGAGVGAAFGIGSLVVPKGRHVRLNRLQQLRVRTTYEIKVR